MAAELRQASPASLQPQRVEARRRDRLLTEAAMQEADSNAMEPFSSVPHCSCRAIEIRPVQEAVTTTDAAVDGGSAARAPPAPTAVPGSSPSFCFEAAWKARAAGAYNQARRILSRGLQLHPTNFRLLINRGYLNYLTKDFASAIEDWEAAVAATWETATLQRSVAAPSTAQTQVLWSAAPGTDLPSRASHGWLSRLLMYRWKEHPEKNPEEASRTLVRWLGHAWGGGGAQSTASAPPPLDVLEWWARRHMGIQDKAPTKDELHSPAASPGAQRSAAVPPLPGSAGCPPLPPALAPLIIPVLAEGAAAVSSGAAWKALITAAGQVTASGGHPLLQCDPEQGAAATLGLFKTLLGIKDEGTQEDSESSACSTSAHAGATNDEETDVVRQVYQRLRKTTAAANRPTSGRLQPKAASDAPDPTQKPASIPTRTNAMRVAEVIARYNAGLACTAAGMFTRAITHFSFGIGATSPLDLRKLAVLCRARAEAFRGAGRFTSAAADYALCHAATALLMGQNPLVGSSAALRPALPIVEMCEDLPATSFAETSEAAGNRIAPGEASSTDYSSEQQLNTSSCAFASLSPPPSQPPAPASAAPKPAPSSIMRRRFSLDSHLAAMGLQPAQGTSTSSAAASVPLSTVIQLVSVKPLPLTVRRGSGAAAVPRRRASVTGLLPLSTHGKSRPQLESLLPLHYSTPSGATATPLASAGEGLPSNLDSMQLPHRTTTAGSQDAFAQDFVCAAGLRDCVYGQGHLFRPAVFSPTDGCLSPDALTALCKATFLQAVSGHGSEAHGDCTAQPPASMDTVTAAARQSLALRIGRSSRLFAGLDPGALLDVCNAFRWKQFKAGEIIYRQGDAADSYYLIVTGSVNVHVDRLASGKRLHDRLAAAMRIAKGWVKAYRRRASSRAARAAATGNAASAGVEARPRSQQCSSSAGRRSTPSALPPCDASTVTQLAATINAGTVLSEPDSPALEAVLGTRVATVTSGEAFGEAAMRAAWVAMKRRLGEAEAHRAAEAAAAAERHAAALAVAEVKRNSVQYLPAVTAATKGRKKKRREQRPVSRFPPHHHLAAGSGRSDIDVQGGALSPLSTATGLSDATSVTTSHASSSSESEDYWQGCGGWSGHRIATVGGPHGEGKQPRALPGSVDPDTASALKKATATPSPDPNGGWVFNGSEYFDVGLQEAEAIRADPTGLTRRAAAYLRGGEPIETKVAKRLAQPVHKVVTQVQAETVAAGAAPPAPPAPAAPGAWREVTAVSREEGTFALVLDARQYAAILARHKQERDADTAAFYATVPFLSMCCSPHELRTLAASSQLVRVPCGGVLLAEGEALRGVYVIRTGKIHVQCQPPPAAAATAGTPATSAASTLAAKRPQSAEALSGPRSRAASAGHQGEAPQTISFEPCHLLPPPPSPPLAVSGSTQAAAEAIARRHRYMRHTDALRARVDAQGAIDVRSVNKHLVTEGSKSAQASSSPAGGARAAPAAGTRAHPPPPPPRPQPLSLGGLGPTETYGELQALHMPAPSVGGGLSSSIGESSASSRPGTPSSRTSRGSRGSRTPRGRAPRQQVSHATLLCETAVDALLIPREALFRCISFVSRLKLKDYARRGAAAAAGIQASPAASVVWAPAASPGRATGATQSALSSASVTSSAGIGLQPHPAVGAAAVVGATGSALAHAPLLPLAAPVVWGAHDLIPASTTPSSDSSDDDVSADDESEGDEVWHRLGRGTAWKRKGGAGGGAGAEASNASNPQAAVAKLRTPYHQTRYRRRYATGFSSSSSMCLPPLPTPSPLGWPSEGETDPDELLDALTLAGFSKSVVTSSQRLQWERFRSRLVLQALTTTEGAVAAAVSTSTRGCHIKRRGRQLRVLQDLSSPAAPLE